MYKLDDAYLNGYAKICGIYATVVYNSLCRHANFYNQECFPSLKKIAEEHNISKPKVVDAEFEFRKVDESKIKKILVEEHDFSAQRVEKQLERLRELKEKQKQKGLSDWV